MADRIEVVQVTQYAVIRYRGDEKLGQVMTVCDDPQIANGEAYRLAGTSKIKVHPWTGRGAEVISTGPEPELA